MENGIAWVLYDFVLFSLQFEVLWALFSENFGSYVYIPKNMNGNHENAHQ